MSNSIEGPVAALFSGQGVQAPGMGKEVYDRFGIAKQVFESATEAVRVDMAEVCFGGLTYLLRNPEIAQAAIATVSLAEYRAWVEENQRSPDVVSGLSMGLYTALSPTRVISYRMDESDFGAVGIVHERAKIIQQIAKDNPGGMGVILGQLRDEISAHLPKDLLVRIGVDRGDGHLLVTGEEGPLKEFIHTWAKRIGERKARILPISTAAHHPLQAAAVEPLTTVLENAIKHTPYIDFLGNSPEDGYLESREQIIRHLLKQMVEEARWDWTMKQLALDGVRYAVEFGDSKRGLTKDLGKASAVQAIKPFTPLQTA